MPHGFRGLIISSDTKASPSMDQILADSLRGESTPTLLLGKYQLRRELGRGGCAIVHEADDLILHRKVAIKMLAISESDPPSTRARLLREARAVARIHHPHVVSLFEIAEQDGSFLLVMEYLPGGSADAWLKRQGSFPWRLATALIRDACAGLAAAHDAGLIHRDLKPGNILLTQDQRAKLADFGLVKLVTAGELADVEQSSTKLPNPPTQSVRADTQRTEQVLTQLGAVAGTPMFMSPEQCCGDPLDNRSDLYSLGASYWTMLTGRPPFPVKNWAALVRAHCMSQVPDPREVQPEIPERCVAILRRAMSKEPRDRYPSAHSLLAELDAALLELDGKTEPIRGVPAQTLGPRSPELEFSPPSTALESGWPTLPGLVTTDLHLKPPPAQARPREPRIRRWLIAGALAMSGLGGLAAWLRPVLSVGEGRQVEAFSIPHQVVQAGVDIPITPAPSMPRTTCSMTGPPPSPILAGGEVQDMVLLSGPERLAWITSGDVDLLHIRELGSWEAPCLEVKLPLDSRRLASTGADHRLFLGSPRSGDLLVIDSGTGRQLEVIEHENAGILALAVSPDNHWLAVGLNSHSDSDKPRIQLHELTNGEIHRGPTLRVHAGAVRALAFAPNGKHMASGSEANDVILWDVDTWRLHGRVLRMTTPFDLAFYNDSSGLATAAFTARGLPALKLDPDRRGLDAIRVDFPVLMYEHTIIVTDFAASRSRTLIGPGKQEIATIAFDPSGHWLAYGGQGRPLFIDLRDDKPLAEPIPPPSDQRHDAVIRAILFREDGKTLITGAADKSIRFWRLPSPRSSQARK